MKASPNCFLLSGATWAEEKRIFFTSPSPQTCISCLYSVVSTLKPNDLVQYSGRGLSRISRDVPKMSDGICMREEIARQFVQHVRTQKMVFATAAAALISFQSRIGVLRLHPYISPTSVTSHKLTQRNQWQINGITNVV